MPSLYGKSYTRRELEARIGRLDAVASIAERRSGSVREIAVRTGGGLSFTAIADRALDVALAHFDDIPLCWSSCNAIGPGEADDGDGFLRSFFGGLFTTCGLGSVGPAGSDEWGRFGLHGRIDSTNAEFVRCTQAWIDESTCVLEITGTVRETRVFGENFRLERRLRAYVGENRLSIHDTVTNDAGNAQPHMILYHCNAGFPILDEHARLYVSHDDVRPRDADAARGLEVWDRGGRPEPDFKEQVFIHQPVACDDGLALAVMWNPEVCSGRGLGIAIRFDPRQLPGLFTWRMLGHGTYVMAIEPANCVTIAGRVEAAKQGTLPFLQPGESRTYDLEFEVVTSLAAFERVASHLPNARAAR